MERFEGFIGGMRARNAFSELNDPVDQRERFLTRSRPSKPATTRPTSLDEDFLQAMEHGMPPTGGVGMGMDRLTMLLTDKPTIRDVILFPLLRG